MIFRRNILAIANFAIGCGLMGSGISALATETRCVI